MLAILPRIPLRSPRAAPSAAVLAAGVIPGTYMLEGGNYITTISARIRVSPTSFPFQQSEQTGTAPLPRRSLRLALRRGYPRQHLELNTAAERYQGLLRPRKGAFEAVFPVYVP